MDLAWIVAGVVIIVGVVFCMRIMRRGISTLEQNRVKYLEHMQEEQRHIDEDKKNISANENFKLLHAAILDLVRLTDRPDDYEVIVGNNVINLNTPSSTWVIELFMRERHLKTKHKVLHGRCQWYLKGPNVDLHFENLIHLMHCLDSHLRGNDNIPKIPDQFSRRLHGSPMHALKRQSNRPVLNK